tara:strand:- start:813 stop:2408 length:1596 start_codon:yes stop_codon:yes gene_type:complete
MKKILIIFIGNLNNFFLHFLKDSIEFNVIDVLKKDYIINILIITNLKEEYNATIFNKSHDILNIKTYMKLYNIDYSIIFDAYTNISFNTIIYDLNNISNEIINLIYIFINAHNFDYIINIPYSCFILTKLKTDYFNKKLVRCNYCSTIRIGDQTKNQKNTKLFNLILPNKYFKYINLFLKNKNIEHISTNYIEECLLYKYNLYLSNDKSYVKYIDIIKNLVSYIGTTLYASDKLYDINNHYYKIKDKIKTVTLINEQIYNNLSIDNFPEYNKQLYYKYEYCKPYICIFIYGQVRTFIYKDVYISWLKNIIIPLQNSSYNYHFIFMFDIINDYSWQQNIDRSKMKLGEKDGHINKTLVENIIINIFKIKNFNIFYYNNNSKPLEESNQMCFDGVWNHKAQYYKMYKLYKFMKHIELKQKIEFNYIIKLRPDLIINDTNIINTLTDRLNEYMYYYIDFVYIIPIHLFNIVFDSILVIANPRINDFVSSILLPEIVDKRKNISQIQYHRLYLYHLLLYNIRSIKLETDISLVRP